MLTVTKVVSRDQQLRSGRVLRVGVASLGRLTRAMDKELKDSKFMERSTCAGGPLVLVVTGATEIFDTLQTSPLWSERHWYV